MTKKILFYIFLFFCLILNIVLDFNVKNYFKILSKCFGINFKTEDGTFGTANWIQENEISEVLGINDTPGIILGKYNNNIVKLPFDSYFNKNICVFGSSR